MDAKQQPKPTLAERREAKARALLEKNAIEAAKAAMRDQADAIKRSVRAEEWDIVRACCESILAQCDAVDPPSERGEG